MAYIVSLPVTSAVLLVRAPPPSPHSFVISSGSHEVWLPASSALVLVAVCHFWGTAIQQLISSVSSSGCSVAGVEQTTVRVKRTAVFYTRFYLIMDHRGRFYEPLKPIKCFRSVLRPLSHNHVIGSQHWIVWNGS
ncbi:unnamed protein product [Ixodes pacificus]